MLKVCQRNVRSKEDFLVHFQCVLYMIILAQPWYLDPGIMNFTILVDGSMPVIIMQVLLTSKSKKGHFMRCNAFLVYV